MGEVGGRSRVAALCERNGLPRGVGKTQYLVVEFLGSSNNVKKERILLYTKNDT